MFGYQREIDDWVYGVYNIQCIYIINMYVYIYIYYIEVVNGEYKPTNITGGHHLVGINGYLKPHKWGCGAPLTMKYIR